VLDDLYVKYFRFGKLQLIAEKQMMKCRRGGKRSERDDKRRGKEKKGRGSGEPGNLSSSVNGAISIIVI